jgi:hypothetical protein
MVALLCASQCLGFETPDPFELIATEISIPLFAEIRLNLKRKGKQALIGQ